MRLFLGALACWAGLHSLRYELTSIGRRVVCRRCQASRWLKGVDVR